MKDEIIAGLKNAVDRGESLEKAVQTFISAGYNPVEVKEAAKNIGRGATNMVQLLPDVQISDQKSQDAENHLQALASLIPAFMPFPQILKTVKTGLQSPNMSC